MTCCVFPTSLQKQNITWSRWDPNTYFSIQSNSNFGELDSFFFIIQTGPDTPLYATTYVSRYIFSLICFRFLFVVGGGGGKAGTCTYLVRIIQKKCWKDKKHTFAQSETPREPRTVYDGYVNLLVKVKMTKYLKASIA